MNPFKQYRIKWGLTIEELSLRMDVTKETILTLEAGRYARPPEWAYDYYQRYGANYLELESGYSNYILSTRREAGRFLGNLPDIFYNLGDDLFITHPFTVWRESSFPLVTMHETANKLCLSKTIIRSFEFPSSSPLKRCPKPLIQALKHAGYRKSETDQLESCYFRYLRNLTNGQPART